MAGVVRQQAEVGLDVVSDGEMSKTSFLAYTDDRLTGFVTTTAPTDPSAAKSGGVWARRVDSRREWRAFREYYTEYLPREMPLASVALPRPDSNRKVGSSNGRLIVRRHDGNGWH